MSVSVSKGNIFINFDYLLYVLFSVLYILKTSIGRINYITVQPHIYMFAQLMSRYISKLRIWHLIFGFDNPFPSRPNMPLTYAVYVCCDISSAK